MGIMGYRTRAYRFDNAPVFAEQSESQLVLLHAHAQPELAPRNRDRTRGRIWNLRTCVASTSELAARRVPWRSRDRVEFNVYARANAGGTNELTPPAGSDSHVHMHGHTMHTDNVRFYQCTHTYTHVHTRTHTYTHVYIHKYTEE